MKNQIKISTIALIFSSLPMLACQGKDKGLAETPKILQKVETHPAGLIVIVDQMAYANGIQTSEEDRVRIIDPQKNWPDGEVVFAEDSEFPSEKPVVTWIDGKLVISFSRDANILFQRFSLGNVQIELIRRKELQGHASIGPFITALNDSQRVWSYDDLTAKVLETCRGRENPISSSEIADWVKLLRVDRPLKTDTTLSPEIQVREVALTCVSELAGESFYPSKGQEFPLRELLATARGGKPEQFPIIKVKEVDWPEILKSLQAWMSNQHDK